MPVPIASTSGVVSAGRRPVPVFRDGRRVGVVFGEHRQADTGGHLGGHRRLSPWQMRCEPDYLPVPGQKSGDRQPDRLDRPSRHQFADEPVRRCSRASAVGGWPRAACRASHLCHRPPRGTLVPPMSMPIVSVAITSPIRGSRVRLSAHTRCAPAARTAGQGRPATRGQRLPGPRSARVREPASDPQLTSGVAISPDASAR